MRFWPFNASPAAASVPEKKTGRAERLVALHVQGRPVWTPRNMEALAREGFMRNAVVYRCVRMIAEAAANIPWLLYENKAEMHEHPLLDLLRHPNSGQSGVDLLESWYGHLQLSGNGYLEIVEIGTSRRELHALRPDRMRVVPDKRGWPSAYEYRVGGRRMIYPGRDAKNLAPILHTRLFHPINDYYGMSPMEAAAYGVDIHNAAGSWSKALLDNSARPSGALVYKGPDGSPNLTEEQFARLKRELEENYEGARNAGRPLLLEGGLEWASMGHSPRDMDFINTKHIAAREIALAFGVPPMLLGIPGDNTFANYTEANRTFWRQTILPLVTRTAAALTQWLSPRFGRGLRLSFDSDRINALASERAALWTRIASSDFLTINEKRAAVGYEPVAGGDEIADQANSSARNPSNI